jgi:TNFR/NGFR cysteine-rich region/Tyrosine-protein kinase ephrin type A/B receptor-like
MRPAVRALLVGLLLGRACGYCPPAYYLSSDGARCLACPPCPPPFSVLEPCGPGPSAGVCGAGIQVELSIAGAGAAGLNLTVALANYSGSAWPAVDATGLDVILRPCPAADQYRSLIDYLCHTCQSCAPPVPVEASPCVTAHDRVCIPPLNVMLQANGTDLILDPDLLIQLLSTIASNGYNSSFSYATYDQVYVTRIPCPPDHYRSQDTGLCHPCTACAPLTLESVPCTPDADRVCGISLVAGFLLQGEPVSAQIAADWDLSLIQVGPDGDALAPSGAPCPAAQFRSPLDGACRACTQCAAGEFVLRNCSAAGDRVCAGGLAVNLSALVAAGVNASLLDAQALHGVLAAALAASQPFPLPGQLPVAPRDVVNLTVTPLPCPAGSYLDTARLACLPCAACAAGQFYAARCSLTADARCQPCRQCGPLEAVARDCAPDADRVCGGNIGVQLYVANASALNRTFLLDDLLGQLLAALPPDAAVDPDYLAHWEAVFSVLAGAYVGYDMTVERLRCTASQYADAQGCADCSECAASAYAVAACTNVSDVVCAPCQTCAAGQYEACPCGAPAAGNCASGNRVCYAYQTFNVSVNVTFVTQYAAADLARSYLPAMQADLRAQTLAAYVGVDVVASAPLGGVALQNPDGTTTVFYGTPPVEGALYPIAGLTPVAPVQHVVRIVLGGVYAQQANADLDFSVLVERALRTAESFLVPAAALANATGGGRRLLAASCQADTYAVTYPSLGAVCVPCQDDPVLSANASTPPALRWQLAAAPCPLNFARVCLGGSSPPLCAPRVTGAIVVVVNASQPVPLACPAGQAQGHDPATGAPTCVGIPCQPGATGTAGYCSPCAAGTYKATVGSTPCTPCPIDTFAPNASTASALGCLPCQNHSASRTGSSNCTCNAGYAGPACVPCAAGTYKLVPSNAPCTPCERGGRSTGAGGFFCSACDAGTYAPDAGLSACLDCPQGEYQNGTGASACSLCAAGYAQASPTPRVACLACPAGVYASAQGASACAGCQAGTYSRGAASACVQCPNGTGVSGPACASCQPGQYGLHGVCLPCPPGAYSPFFASTACAPCAPGGFTAAPGATNLSQCLPCQEGAYWDPLGCLGCPANTAAPRGSVGASSCLAVPGYYGLPGQRALACPAGSYCPQASMVPFKCPSGSVSAQGSQACTATTDNSVVHQFDGLIAASWFVVTFLGIGCLVRTKRFWRRSANTAPSRPY